MFFFFNIVFSVVQEHLIESHSYLHEDDRKNFSLRNLHFTKNGIAQDSTAGSSLIKMVNEIHEKNFSYEVDFKLPELISTESIGLYFWFTENEIEKGNFHGGPNIFNGFFSGIEFSGKTVNLIVAANNGKLELTNRDHILLTDTPNPARFFGLKHLKLKIIVTENNFKIEIINTEDGKIVYDRLRFIEKDELGDLQSFSHMAITTNIVNLSGEKEFLIEKLQLNERYETEKYDVKNFESPHIISRPRDSHEIDHSSSEIQHLISNLEYFMSYVRLVLGDSTGHPINQQLEKMEEKYARELDYIRSINENIEHLNKHSEKNSLSNISLKLKSLETHLNEIKRQNFNYRFVVGEVQDMASRLVRNISIIVLMFSALSVGALAFSIYMKSKKTIKLE